MSLRATCLMQFAAIALGLPWAATPARADFSFAISPPRFELVAKPGERLRQTIEITNVSSAAAALMVRTADWEFRPDETVAFHEDIQPGSCRRWFAIERRELAVAPRLPYRFRFEVAPPADQAAIECRVAIMFEGKDPTFAGESASVPIGARVAVIVYVAVGDVAPELAVTHGRVEERNGQPIAVIDVQNTGTAHGRLDGFLTGTDAGRQVLDVTAASTPIMPGETRAIVLSVARQGDANTPVQVMFPLAVKGKLEWGNRRSTELDLRLTR